MAYEAVLVARHGLGVDELELASGAFAAAIRWALFAERASEGLAELREEAETPTPDSLVGAKRTEFMSQRTQKREQVKATETAIYPEDDDGG